jgi:hypothetical protein
MAGTVSGVERTHRLLREKAIERWRTMQKSAPYGLAHADQVVVLQREEMLAGGAGPLFETARLEAPMSKGEE